jgi:hypothetical protein
MQMKKVFIANLKTSTRQTYFIFFEIIQRMGPKALVQVILKLFESIERTALRTL